MKQDTHRHHPLSFVAFLLAMLTLVAPLQVDVVFVSLLLGKTAEALLTVIGSVSLVSIPLLIAMRATRLHPDKWKPRLLTKWTVAIVVINLLFNACLFAQHFLNTNGANKAIQVIAA